MNHRKNFETLCRAFHNRDVVMFECVGPNPGERIGIICAVNRPTDGGLPEYVALATLLDKPLAQVIVPRGRSISVGRRNKTDSYPKSKERESYCWNLVHWSVRPPGRLTRLTVTSDTI